MLRRAWFSALTDVNMSVLFPPGQDAGGAQVRAARAGPCSISFADPVFALDGGLARKWPESAGG